MKTSNKIRKKFGSLIVEHKLIEDDDHILVAVSGGKDSLLLLTLLVEARKRFPIDYKITACHLKNELTEEKLREETALYLENHFKSLNIPYIIEELPVIKESNPKKKLSCFWCSWLRRKYLFQLASKNNIKKVALGHHKDDVIETLLLNLFYHGKIATMPAKLSMFDGELTLIRPMASINESDILKTVKDMGLKTSSCLCQMAGNTKRNTMKEIIKDLEKEFKHIRTSLFNATEYDKIDPTYMN